MTTTLDLREAGLGTGTGARRRARLIEANVWGSTAYYPAEVLERDGPRVFHAGLQMFENHLTDSEKWDRPEGDVGKLIGKLLTDAVFEEDGLYADVEFYESYLPRINEIADDIGLSVRAHGLTEEAEMDGRYGPVLLGLLSADSVDVVTKAGAGGKLVSIIESHRETAGTPVDTKKDNMTDITKEDFEAFTTRIEASIEGLVGSLQESLAGVAKAPVVEKTAEELAAEAAKNEDPAAIVVDHVAVVEALRKEDLPAASAGSVVKDILEGKTLEEAIKVQTDLREAFSASDVTGGAVVLKENAKTELTGLARATAILG